MIKKIEIKGKEDAEKHKFLGSPAIRIGDTELSSEVDESPKPSLNVCRIYLYKGKLFEYPPRDMIKEFILGLSVFKDTVKEGR